MKERTVFPHDSNARKLLILAFSYISSLLYFLLSSFSPLPSISLFLLFSPPFLLTSPLSFSVSESAIRAVKLNAVEDLGIDVAIRYGESLKLLSQANARSQLEHVHKTVQLMLTQQQKQAPDSEIGEPCFHILSKSNDSLITIHCFGQCKKSML